MATNREPPGSAWANRAFLLTLLLAFGWVLVLRGVLVLHSSVSPSSVWMLLSDAAGAVLLALLLSLPGPRLLRALILLLLATAYYAAGQHIATHGTLFRLAHMGHASDPAFLSGSVLQGRLLLLSVYWMLALVMLRLHHKLVPIPTPAPRASLGLAVLLVAIYAAAVPSLTVPANNVVISSLAQIPGAVANLRRPPEPDDIQPVAADLEAMFFQHQRGQPATAQQRPNVLLVIIEGLSAGYFPTVAAHHGLDPVVALPQLEQDLEARGFRIYRNVLGMQRQTNRGSYALLCGSYPRLWAAPPKMRDVAEGRADPTCLPELLARNGYFTGYLQAAPLEFMDKDAFMPRIGYDLVHGAEFFGPPEDIEGWGPPDYEFFPAAAAWVEELDAMPGPWFATTLNIGTHHPFPAAEQEIREAEAQTDGSALAPEERQDQRRAAFNTMAGAVTDFLDHLQSAGVLNRTLVIITSDESGGFLRQDDQPALLDGNFGVLAVRPPRGMSLQRFVHRDALVANLDVPLTALDVTGTGGGGEMTGRSLLVTDATTERGILLGDTYSGRAFFLRESGQLLACDESLLYCNTWGFEPDRLFGSLAVMPDEEPLLDLSTRRQLVQRAAAIEVPAVPVD